MIYNNNFFVIHRHPPPHHTHIQGFQEGEAVAGVTQSPGPPADGCEDLPSSHPQNSSESFYFPAMMAPGRTSRCGVVVQVEEKHVGARVGSELMKSPDEG